MADRQGNQLLFILLGVFSSILLINIVYGTEEQQLWATSLKEKALGMQFLALNYS